MASKKKILLLGAGGHCMSVIDSLMSSCKYDSIGIVDKVKPVGYTVKDTIDNNENFLLGVPIVGCDDDLPRLHEEGFTDAFITVGSIGNPQLRRKLYQKLKGIGFGLAAATLYALVIIMNKLTKDMEGLETTVIQLTLASLIITVYVIYNGGIGWEVPSSHAIIRLLLVGFLNTGLAYLLYFTSVQRLESQTVAIFSYIDPISAVMMSALFMGEKLSAPQIAGGILILASAFISGRDKKSTHN